MLLPNSKSIGCEWCTFLGGKWFVVVTLRSIYNLTSTTHLSLLNIARTTITHFWYTITCTPKCNHIIIRADNRTLVITFTYLNERITKCKENFHNYYLFAWITVIYRSFIESTMVTVSSILLQWPTPRCPAKLEPIVKMYPPSTNTIVCVEEKLASSIRYGNGSFF